MSTDRFKWPDSFWNTILKLNSDILQRKPTTAAEILCILFASCSLVRSFSPFYKWTKINSLVDARRRKEEKKRAHTVCNEYIKSALGINIWLQIGYISKDIYMLCAKESCVHEMRNVNFRPNGMNNAAAAGVAAAAAVENFNARTSCQSSTASSNFNSYSRCRRCCRCCCWIYSVVLFWISATTPHSNVAHLNTANKKPYTYFVSESFFAYTQLFNTQLYSNETSNR